MSEPIRRISINTGGGDAPGLNAVIYSVVHAASRLGWQVLGIREGYDGLMYPDLYPDGGVMELTLEKVKNIPHLGGTMLGTTNRGNPFRALVDGPGGTPAEADLSDRVMEGFRRHEIDAHVAVGGDGSLTIALQLHRKGLRVVGVPKTIDNDLESTNVTFGFASAVSFATECIDRLHMTAQAHRRIIVVEVMGRNVGWIALYTGLAGQADAILIPEIPYDLNKVACHLLKATEGERKHAIVVVAEGAKPAGGDVTVKSREPGRVERLGGIGETVANELEGLTGKEARAVILGHLLRGGSPVAQDRILGMGFGAGAIHALKKGMDGVMVALNPPRIEFVPLADAVVRQRPVPLDGEAVLAARTLDICFGD
ncbi:MAG TPA: ATP-dependent 6-phosphofructokinase [Candidatus Acidoferrales bacterium]|nr:ATP-dependent 6-phosphofructokinase [Candidatus Acidoferrales bacterium]